MKKIYRVILDLSIDRDFMDDPESWDWAELLDMDQEDIEIVSALPVNNK